jgi:hypothetical protein
MLCGVCSCLRWVAVAQYGDLYWKLLRGREGSAAAARSQTIPGGDFFCAKRNSNGDGSSSSADADVGASSGCRPIGEQQILTP